MQRLPQTADCPVLPAPPTPQPAPKPAGAPPPSTEPPPPPAAPAARAAVPTAAAPPPAPRGFQLIDPQQHRLIASRGGKIAHARGLAHRYTREEAQVAGRKGGAVTSRDREHMSRIGRKGGRASGRSDAGRTKGEEPAAR